MFARVSTYEGRPEQLDEMHQEGMEHVLPALEMQDGFSGGLVLADRQSGEMLVVTLWESEQAMDATEDASHWLRIFGAQSRGGTISSVQRYALPFSSLGAVLAARGFLPSGRPAVKQASGITGVRYKAP